VSQRETDLISGGQVERERKDEERKKRQKGREGIFTLRKTGALMLAHLLVSTLPTRFNSDCIAANFFQTFSFKFGLETLLFLSTLSSRNFRTAHKKTNCFNDVAD
jgi:hypothetical protein